MYLDIFLGLVLIITISSIALTGQLLYSFSELKENYDVNFFNIACISLLCIAYMTIAVYLVTLSKRVKLGRVIKTTLLYKLSSLIFRIFKRWGMGIKNGFNSGPLLIKAILFLVIYTIILFIDVEVLAHKSIMSFIVFIILTTGAFYLLAKRVTSFRVMTEGIKKVKNGELSYKIPLCGSYTIDSIAEDINNIAEGLRGAVENEMKAEHMKVELITNVSHDLKTPLTSIITYIDLLSKENTAQEDTKEYIEILRAKSAKLNNLVEDLFEVSKAQSGTTPLKLEKLCLNDLITQSYAEYQDAFETARLEIKFNIPQTKIMVLADGAKMWRVLSNVFNNTLKYSLEGTRVYLDVEVLQDKAIITFKNISNYAMNFKANEIAERFKRGDESRSSEGSGLGLAIVKSFMDMQKGSSEITVDGDLFKIKLILKNEI
jgi:signal transduction histidine kinase